MTQKGDEMWIRGGEGDCDLENEEMRGEVGDVEEVVRDMMGVGLPSPISPSFPPHFSSHHPNSSSSGCDVMRGGKGGGGEGCWRA